MNIRPTRAEDISALIAVADETGLFPGDMLPAMLDGYLTGNPSQSIWLTCEAHGAPIGFCYAEPEPLAEGTWNMLAIAVLPSRQGRGSGGAMVERLESELRGSGHRVLIADTSGTDAYAPTREFYRKAGYTQEARIRDFWADGDDKIVFWKAL